jgi:hypothetical protein
MMERHATVHYSLECPRAHLIPIPRPSRSGIDSNLRETATDVAHVFVACPECGLVSAYSALNVLKRPEGIPDPFEAEICHFVVLSVECDGKDCDTPTSVHTAIGSDKGTWKEKVFPIDWKFSPECTCENGHHLVPHWKDYPHTAWERRRSPF